MRGSSGGQLGFVESFVVGVLSKATATLIIYPLIRAKVLQASEHAPTHLHKPSPSHCTNIVTEVCDHLP